MKKTLFLLIFLVATFWASSAFAQQSSYRIGSWSFSCVDSGGSQVAFFNNPNLNDIGKASAHVQQNPYGGPTYRPYIVFNPRILKRHHPKVQMFWFAHECAHHALGQIRNFFRGGGYPKSSESQADCYAVKTLRYRYGFSRKDIFNISRTLMHLPGSSRTGHLPGPQRARLLQRCAAY